MWTDTIYLVKRFFSQHGTEIIIATIFLVASVLFAYLVGRLIASLLLDRLSVSIKIVRLIVRTFRITIITLAIITLLNEFGIQIVSLLTGLGVVGFGLALGARTSINNMITGIMLNSLSPYEEGDYIEGERVKGIVEKITLFHTVIATADGKYVSVPNGPMWAKSIKNLSRPRPRVVEFTIVISRLGDFDDLMRRVKSAFVESRLRISKLPIDITVEGIADDGVTLRGTAWTRAESIYALVKEIEPIVRDEVAKAGSVLDEISTSLSVKPLPKKADGSGDTGDDL